MASAACRSARAWRRGVIWALSSWSRRWSAARADRSASRRPASCCRRSRWGARARRAASRSASRAARRCCCRCRAGRACSRARPSSASARRQASRLSPSSSSLRRRGSASSWSAAAPKPSWPERGRRLPPVMAPLRSSSSPSRVTARQRPSSRRALARLSNTRVSPKT